MTVAGLTAAATACRAPVPEPPPQPPSTQSWHARGLGDPESVARAQVLERVVREGMTRWAVPGVSVSVADGGELVWSAAFGWKAAGGEAAVDLHTPFQAASVSKPVTSATVLALVEAGVLDLDAPAARWLDPWPLLDPPDDRITLRRLLSHTAGLGRHGFAGYREGEAVPTLAQILAGEPPTNHEPVRIEAEPGSAFGYSGGGYVLLEMVIEAATGEAFAEVARREVLEPAGMADSRFGGDGGDPALGHRADGVLVPGGRPRHPELAAAGLWSTATDLVRFALHLQAGLGTEEDAGRPVFRLMMTPAEGAERDPDRRPGLGVFLAGEGPAGRFFHGGANRGYRAVWIGTLGTGQAAAVMTNGDGGERLAWEVLDAVATAYGWPSPDD